MSKQPLYPHVPKGRLPATAHSEEGVKATLLPDSQEQILLSMQQTGYQEKLEQVVREALARVKRR